MKLSKKLLFIMPFLFLISSLRVYAQDDNVIHLMQDEIIVSLEDMPATIRNCKQLSVHSKPSNSSKVVANIPYGECFSVTDQIGKWFKITYEDITGFVFWNYISFIEEDIVENSGLIGNSIIHYTSSDNRDNNIDIACKAINGIVLKPGAEFKWSDIVGQTTAEKGYLEAPIILNSQITTDLGGGVCQVSTTLYNALLDTKITPSELYHHSIGSSYSKNDATVVYGSKDFIFCNTYDFSIEIEAYSYKSVICVNIYKFK